MGLKWFRGFQVLVRIRGSRYLGSEGSDCCEFRFLAFRGLGVQALFCDVLRTKTGLVCTHCTELACGLPRDA